MIGEGSNPVTLFCFVVILVLIGFVKGQIGLPRILTTERGTAMSKIKSTIMLFVAEILNTVGAIGAIGASIVAVPLSSNTSQFGDIQNCI